MQVDCSSLPEGLHFAEISAVDSTAPWRGPLFRVPVTIIKPASVGSTDAPSSSGTGAVESSGDILCHAVRLQAALQPQEVRI